MNKLKNKLRSRAGASMILAMIFMLFCTFIGGTVLASATANAQRVAQMAEQQDFYLEQSAALLVTDQLQMDSGKYVRLIVADQDRTIQGINIVNGGQQVDIPGKLDYDRVITFQVISNTTITPLHELMLEGAVWRYLEENTADEDPDKLIRCEFQNFPRNTFLFSDPRTPEDRSIEGSLTISATTPSGSTLTEIPSYTANFSIGQDDHIYDFFIDFGENSQLKMTMNAFSGKGTPTTATQVTQNDTGLLSGVEDVRITSISTQTTISWEAPLVEKGGAAR